MNPSVNGVVILGGGSVAWLAAAALHRAFGHRKLQVTVVDTGPARDAPVGRWTLPSQRGMHSLLGIKEVDFLRNTGATFKLATEHRGWQGKTSRFLHAHGDIGWDVGSVPFYKYLLIQHSAGRQENPENYSLAAVAARLGRFARPMGEAGELTASFTYAFHVDETAYVAHLRQHAIALGVRVVTGSFADLTLSATGDISAITLADGQRLEAGLFLDCSGPDAALMSRVSDGAREDWSAHLPCDRMWSARAAAVENPPAMTVTTATRAGWRWQAPLADSTVVGHVFSSAHLAEDEALAELRQTAPGLVDPLLNRFSSGRRKDFWSRNCVALGGAAVELEPLVGAELHLAQLGIATLIELFPLERYSHVDGAEYNRVMGDYSDRLRDFTLAHYHCSSAPGGEFWSQVRSEPLPASVAERLELYAANGRINLLDFETFEEVDWAWLFMGAGDMPDGIELQVRAQLEKLTPSEVTSVQSILQRLASSMPRHIDYVRHQQPRAANAPKT